MDAKSDAEEVSDFEKFAISFHDTHLCTGLIALGLVTNLDSDFGRK